MTGNMSPEDKIIEARVKALSKMPFYGSLFLHLRIKENTTCIPTAGVTPYGTMYYNPKFIEQLSVEEVQFVLAHEVLHICLLHLERFGNRNRTKCNIAADLAINNIISKDFKFPAIIDKRLMDKKYENMSMEEIYDKLPHPEECKMDCSKCPINNGKAIPSEYGQYKCKYGSFDKHITKEDMDKAQGKGSGKDKDSKDGKGGNGELRDLGLPDEVKDELEKNAPNWRKIMNDSLEVAKRIGNMPAGLERLVEDLVEPQLSWKEILAQFITRSIPFNFHWRKPSRKSISAGFYMPSVQKEEIDVCMVVDTSGSMSDIELRECMSEVLGLLRTFEQVKITLFSCDTQLSEASKISSEYDIQTTRLVGGGGTTYRPIFKLIKEHELDTKVLIYLGDMYAEFPSQSEVPVGLTTIFIVTKSGDINAIPDFFKYKVQLK